MFAATITSAATNYRVIVLHSAEFTDSRAVAASDGEQVGLGWGLWGSKHHALLWSGTAESVVDLNPIGFDQSEADGVWGGIQVGWGKGPATGGYYHALQWSGTGESYVDLNPPGFTHSYAWDIHAGQKAGFGDNVATGRVHALLWPGTAASAVDLHPRGFDVSHAFDIWAGQQVGDGTGPATGGRCHALLWSGTAESVVDLHPIGFDESEASGVSGGLQVGYGYVGGQRRALLWFGTPESVVDLHPAGFDYSEATGVSGGVQAGAGRGTATGGIYHALLWSGTAESVVDLHTYLPSGYDFSWGYDIDSAGNIVGFASGPDTGDQAVMWVPVVAKSVKIDIKPGSHPNAVNLGTQGLIPIAILSSPDFDATTVDPETVELAGAGVAVRGKGDKYMAHEEDVDGDGLVDLVVQVSTENLEPGSFQDGYAVLTGQTHDGTPFEGRDEITIVPE